MDSFAFGDSPAMADELLGLVLSGKKTATAWAASQGIKGTEVGKREVIKDGAGRERVIIETTEIVPRPFSEVDASFARDEGEGDLSLAYWRQAHKRYFTREGTYADDMEVYCQRFRIVEVL
ncbi:MAG: ASCH domain-containing protein [bacterium]